MARNALRRTGRRRNRPRRGSKKNRIRKKFAKRARNARKRFGISTMQRRKLRVVRGGELKYVDLVGGDGLGVLPYLNADGNSSPPTILPCAVIGNFIIQRGLTRSNFEGKLINLLSMEVNFTVTVNQRAWPNTNELKELFRNGAVNNVNLGANQQPRLRVSVVWQKNGTADGVPNQAGSGFPNGQLYGFSAPWDINTWKVLEDKYYTLTAGAGLAEEFNYVAGKNSIRFSKRFPLRMTATMDDTGDEGNFSPELSHYFFICLSTNAFYYRADNDQYLLTLTDCHSRLYFRDP